MLYFVCEKQMNLILKRKKIMIKSTPYLLLSNNYAIISDEIIEDCWRTFGEEKN